MSGLVLDAGALIAVDRDNRAVIAQIRAAKERGERVRTNGMALAQVWRDGARQALLAKVLRDVDVEPIPGELGREAGELLGATRTKDAIDASVALLAGPGDRILTSDPDDLRLLSETAGTKAEVIRC